MTDAIIGLEQVKTHFPYRKNFWGRPTQWVRAVDGVNLTIVAGECLGLVGESGCGKSTLGRSILCMAPVVSGSVLFHGKEIQGLDHEQLRPLRPKMQMVFQDPRASLNPRMTVLQILSEAAVHLPRLRSHAKPGTICRTARYGGPAARASVPVPARIQRRRSSSGSASPGPWPPSRNSSSSTRPPVRWTFPSRPRSST